ncbi:hypothetical protein [Clostridium butyricum]|uniref:hypothetical protein n=1 Tax=Clostridium butyricum TaxID=1492 RepID=UPI0009045779|nr:hypothetical protein [Clostridium butyricum]APF21219.1 putative membrane protein [Clostridium butyricum]
MEECIETAIKNSCIWLTKKILIGTFTVADFITPIFLLICIGLSITGAKKPKQYAIGSVMLYLFLQIFRIFI